MPPKVCSKGNLLSTSVVICESRHEQTHQLYATKQRIATSTRYPKAYLEDRGNESYPREQNPLHVVSSSCPKGPRTVISFQHKDRQYIGSYRLGYSRRSERASMLQSALTLDCIIFSHPIDSGGHGVLRPIFLTHLPRYRFYRLANAIVRSLPSSSVRRQQWGDRPGAASLSFGSLSSRSEHLRLFFPPLWSSVRRFSQIQCRGERCDVALLSSTLCRISVHRHPRVHSRRPKANPKILSSFPASQRPRRHRRPQRRQSSLSPPTLSILPTASPDGIPDSCLSVAVLPLYSDT